MFIDWSVSREQVARVTSPGRKEMRGGREVVFWDSMAVPTKPDVIDSSIRKSTVSTSSRFAGPLSSSCSPIKRDRRPVFFTVIPDYEDINARRNRDWKPTFDSAPLTR